MTLSIPPTMIVMRVRFAECADAVVVATSTPAMTTSAASIATYVRFIRSLLEVSQGNFVPVVRPPLDETVLERRDEELGRERDHGEDEHRGEDCVRVEGPLGEGDQVAEPVDRADELADDRAHEGEPEARVETRDDPRQRR